MIGSTIILNRNIGLQSIRGCWKTLKLKTIVSIKSWFLLILSHGRLSLGLLLVFVCCLRVCHVSRFVLHGLQVPLPLLIYLVFGLWLWEALDPLSHVHNWFMFGQVLQVVSYACFSTTISPLSWHLVNERIQQSQLRYWRCFCKILLLTKWNS